ncbi:MAG: hypothetical protein JO053_05520, partial [Acidobacteria bacterium]|nr:hypothetical protein [Acidobacteriota bacterium]
MYHPAYRRAVLPISIFIGVAVVMLAAPSTEGQIRGWGYNATGQIAIGNNTDPQPNPVTVASVPDAVEIRAGDSHTLFLKANGTVAAAGLNTDGELGNGNIDSGVSSPTAVSALTGVIHIGAGGFHSAALRSDGTVWSWGFNQFGETGNGTTATSGCSCTPSPAQSSIAGVVSISLGFDHTLALKSDGTVWAWGFNGDGELGDGTTTNRSSPVQVGLGVANFNNIIAISAGEMHSLALKGDGTVWVWGFNGDGEIGNGSTSGPQFSPVMNQTLSGISQIFAGAAHNLARASDGTVWVWGSNTYGQGGNGVGTNQLTPVTKTNVSNVVDIFGSGSFHNAVRTRGGSILTWGYNADGEIGSGTVDSFLVNACECQSTPTIASVGSGNALTVAGRFGGFAGSVNVPTPSGTSIFIPGEQVRFIFGSVSASGTTSYSAIDPTTTGLTVPSGYSIKGNAPAFNISSTAALVGNMDVCLNVAETDSQSNFGVLKVLHEENGSLVDRTFSSSYVRREICARVTSLSRFIIAEASVTTPTPTPGGTRTNVALATNGGTASASSYSSGGYSPAGTINGDRT